jgi:hypothetical protein
MNGKYSRRDFLKLAGFGLAGLAFTPYVGNSEQSGQLDNNIETVRIATKSVSVYSQPWDKSKILYQHYFDDVVNVYYPLVSDKGPAWNPVWYRVWGGYIHSAYVETVKNQLNSVISTFPEKGQLARITVPYTQSMRYNPIMKIWTPFYRLYYGSNHWIMGVIPGPDGQPWYHIKDDLKIDYYASAPHLSPIGPEEFAPISADVPPSKKRIEVSISQQTLTAYEYNKVVLKTKISSGVPEADPPPGKTPTDTPVGNFYVYSKMPSKHMGDGKLVIDPSNYYELPGVPWTSFFAPEGVATHGTYWHTNYGNPMSHGCVNMRTEDAHWIFRWTTPVAAPDSWETRGWEISVKVS